MKPKLVASNPSLSLPTQACRFQPQLVDRYTAALCDFPLPTIQVAMYNSDAVRFPVSSCQGYEAEIVKLLLVST
jgi:hypothetical protein